MSFLGQLIYGIRDECDLPDTSTTVHVVCPASGGVSIEGGAEAVGGDLLCFFVRRGGTESGTHVQDVPPPICQLVNHVLYHTTALDAISFLTNVS